MKSNGNDELRGPDGLSVRWEWITPESAGKYLATTRKNRNKRTGKVKAYGADMKAGRWRFNGDTICFDVFGAMVDGQHRCQACVDTGRPFLALIVSGLASETQDTMDIGAPRTAGDQLHLRGETSGKTLAAVIRVVARLNSGSRSFSAISDVTTPEIIEIFELDRDGFRRAARVGTAIARRHPVAASLMGGAYYVCNRLDAGDATTFYEDQLAEGIGLLPGDPALVLGNRFALGATREQWQRKNGVPTRRMHPDDQIRYTLLAWNAFRDRRQMSKLQAPRGGWTPKNFPDPQ